MESKTLATLGDGPHAQYIQTLVDQVAEQQRDGGAKAQVAALAVRGIVRTTDVEWAVLVETYGIPTTRDWEMAQAAYGPNPTLPAGGAGATLPLAAFPDLDTGHEALIATVERIVRAKMDPEATIVQVKEGREGGFGIVLYRRHDSHHPYVVHRWATHDTARALIADGGILYSGGYWPTYELALEDFTKRNPR